MAIEVVDVNGLGADVKKRQVIMNTRKMHAWEHYLAEPGDGTDMHCHPGDQTFLVLEGECTMRFPDGGEAVMKPGVVALIEGGSFYQLVNSNDGPTVLMGTRTGTNNANKHIDFDSREDTLMPGERDEKVLGVGGAAGE
jgi:quercetin dioxygenase-like cupin family protein